MFLESGGKTLNVVECQLSNNIAVGFGGGMYAAGDGLIAVTASSACGSSLPQLYGWTNVGDVTLCLQCDDCEDGVASDAPCNTGIRGDFNCDGVYNEADYFDMQADLGICPGDLTGDGRVDGQDLGLLFAAWGLCL